MKLSLGAKAVMGPIGGMLGVFGFLGLLGGLIRLIDPSSMADDGNPFAPTVAAADTLWPIALSFGAFVVGTWLCVRLGRDA